MEDDAPAEAALHPGPPGSEPGVGSDHQEAAGRRTTLPLLYPEGGKYYPGNGIVPAVPSRPVTGDLNIYWRALETGPRANEVETDEYRILLGISGLAWGWDYNAGTYYISSEATENYLAGYLLESKLLPAMYSGVINPFGYNDAAGLAALNATQALGQMRTAKTTAWVIDGVAVKEIVNLPAGPMSLAVGFQYQSQEYTDTPSATPVVHAGYVPRRHDLLRAGVRLFELRPTAARDVREERPYHGSSASAGLHAKTFAVDRERIFVGSFNFDQRSALLNTEVGLVIESPHLAGRLGGAFDTNVPLAPWEVRLAADGRSLEWIERRPGGETRHATEPGTTWSQRMKVDMLSILPIEWLL